MKKLAVVVLLIAAFFWWYKTPTVSVLNGTIDFEYIVKYSSRGRADSHLPMLVALHGNGDTASHFHETALDKIQTPARFILLKGPLAYGGGDAWPTNKAGLTQYGPAVKEAVEAIALEYPTTGKPLLFGFSGGAIMAYYQAAVYGDTYSYIFPISGRLSENILPKESVKSDVKVYAFHGKQDTLVSFNGGQNAANILKTRNIQVNFIEFDGGHQGIFTNMKAPISRLVDEKLAATY